MKKFLFSLLTLGALVSVASCQKELPVGNPDPLQGGPAVAATVSVNVNGVATKAFAAAENAKKLHIAFYSGGELVASISKVGAEAIDLTSTSYDYNVKLSRGAAYDIICWAEAEAEDSPYALDFEAKTVTYKDNVSLTANNDAYDAFYGVASLTADQTKNTVDLTIELKRPFAQVNVLVPDENAAAYTSFSSTMTVTVPTTMSLADGSLSGDPVAVEFANAAIDETTIKEGHTYVAMNYVFAPAEAANYAVSFTVTPNVAADAKEIDLDAVSLKRNRRTNLVGSIFDTEVDGNITVVIIPTTDDPEEQDINAVDADLHISLDPEATLDVPVGEPASFTITTNSTGTASVASADTDIATAEVATDGSAQATNIHTVTVTGVANGTTTVTVDITAGQTKASLKPAQVVVTVNVTGETPVEKTLESIAISDYTTEYTVGDTFSFDGTVTATYSDQSNADVTASATVSAAPDMTAAAENVPFTVSYKEGDITKTANGSINVTAAEAQGDFSSIAELKTLTFSTATEYTGSLTDAVVSFVPAANTAIIKDATGSMMLYKADHGLLQGQTISGEVSVTTGQHNNANQITALTATVSGSETAVAPETVTLADLAANYSLYENAYVKVVGVTSKTTANANNSNVTVEQNGTEYIVFTYKAVPVNEGDVFTAEGTVTCYNTTKELKVWAASDLTVTQAAPVLSATPATKTVNADETSVTWTITSNTNWTISPGTGVTTSSTSGNGDAEVTLSFAANTTNDSKEFTATVSAEGCADVTITITQNGSNTIDYSIIETSNVTLTAGTNGTAALVNNQEAIKVGTSSKGGDMSVTVPAGTTKLHVHAAAWNGVTGLSLDLTGATCSPTSISLTPDTGIANSSPFTLSGNPEDFYFEVTLSGIEAETTIKFTSSSAKRFVVWGVNVE